MDGWKQTSNFRPTFPFFFIILAACAWCVKPAPPLPPSPPEDSDRRDLPESECQKRERGYEESLQDCTILGVRTHTSYNKTAEEDFVRKLQRLALVREVRRLISTFREKWSVVSSFPLLCLEEVRSFVRQQEKEKVDKKGEAKAGGGTVVQRRAKNAA